MAALRWTAVAAVTGVLASHSGPAAAQDPVPTPTATATPVPTPIPTLTPIPTATPTPLPVPVPPPPAVAGTVIYIITVTTTTTTTAINAPITWVAAPITTNVSNTSATNDTTANNVNGTTPGTQASNSAGAGGGAGAGAAGDQTELSLSGCARRAKARSARGKAVLQTARIRVPSNARVAVRVNGKAVGNLQLDPGARKKRGIPLRVELAANGVLTVYRPSGRILRVQACTPK